MKKEDLEKYLFNSIDDEEKQRYLFEQYKLYIESAEKISDRRQKTNEFFLALNTAIITGLGFAIGKNGNTLPLYFYLLAGIGGAAICYLWYRIIRSYKGLNGGKFNVIHMIETKLPLSLYDTEWEILGRGENKKIYWPFSHIEINVPWIFMLIYISFLLKFIIPILIALYPLLSKPI